MTFSKMSILYLNLVSPAQGVVRIYYYNSRYVCEQTRKWQMEKFPTSILVIKSPSTESFLLKVKFIPFTRSTSDTFPFMWKHTFNCPVCRKCDPHIWTLAPVQWGTSPTLNYDTVIKESKYIPLKYHAKMWFRRDRFLKK
jgi:hypothetical protein